MNLHFNIMDGIGRFYYDGGRIGARDNLSCKNPHTLVLVVECQGEWESFVNHGAQLTLPPIQLKAKLMSRLPTKISATFVLYSACLSFGQI